VRCRPNDWTFEVARPRRSAPVAIAFSTKLTFRIEATLSGPAKLAEGMVTKSFDQMADKTLANVKAMAEA